MTTAGENKHLNELDPIQYERIYWEEDVPLRDLRHRLLKWFWIIGLGLFVLFLVVANWVRFPDQIELPFVLKREQSEDIYRYPYPVYVQSRMTQAGRPVKAGLPLVEITSPEIAEWVNELNAAADHWAHFKTEKTDAIQRKQNILRNHLLQNQSRIADREHQLKLLEEQWKSRSGRLQYEYDDAADQLERMTRLHESKALSRFDWLQYESRKIRAGDALLNARKEYEKQVFSLQQEIHQLRLENDAENEEISRLSNEFRFDSSQLFSQRKLAEERIAHSFGAYEIRDGSLILKSNRDVVVSYLFDGEKEVPEGSILMKLAYGDTSLYASVNCPPSLIGKLQAAREVHLKVASFPFYEWGSVHARVEQRSLTPDEKGNFPVRIRITDPGRLSGLIQAGMNGNAVLILDEKTFMEYFFLRLKKISYKLMTGSAE